MLGEIKGRKMTREHGIRGRVGDEEGYWRDGRGDTRVLRFRTDALA